MNIHDRYQDVLSIFMVYSNRCEIAVAFLAFAKKIVPKIESSL